MHTVETLRNVDIVLDDPPTIDGLITELTAIRDRQAIGPTATVTNIRGGGARYSVTIAKSD